MTNGYRNFTFTAKILHIFLDFCSAIVYNITYIATISGYIRSFDMILQINLKQLGSRKKIAPVPFEYPTKPETLRQLITETVTLCVNDYNNRVRAGENNVKLLTDEEISAMANVGKIAFGIVYGKEQDMQKALDNAILSFEDGLYRVFHGENELTELDAPLDMNENDELTFIRLTMLTGRLW